MSVRVSGSVEGCCRHRELMPKFTELWLSAPGAAAYSLKKMSMSALATHRHATNPRYSTHKPQTLTPSHVASLVCANVPQTLNFRPDTLTPQTRNP